MRIFVLLLILMSPLAAESTDQWMTRYEDALARWLSVEPVRPKLVLVANRKALAPFHATYIPKAQLSAETDCFYVASQNTIYCYECSWLRKTLQHEIFHAFAAHRLPEQPTWLNEGTAELCENFKLHDDGTLTLGNTEGRRLRKFAWLAGDGRASLEKMQAVSTDQFYGDPRPNYTTSYVTALWLFRSDTLLRQLRNPRQPMSQQAWLQFTQTPGAW